LPTVASDVDIVVEDDPARIVARRLAALARDGGSVVLTGGSTPRAAYETAAALNDDWTSVELWWGDERCVGRDDPRSNYGMAKAALLDRVATGAVHRMQGELGRDEGARRYELELEEAGRFDLVLLGIGPDGHVASLFPGEPSLDETARRAIGADAKLEPFVDRITLTLPVLRSAGEVLFLATGASKAAAVRRAFAGAPSRETPASLVRAAGGKTTAVLDAAAAGLL
jgi:6-phosphogluconolactonase